MAGLVEHKWNRGTIQEIARKDVTVYSFLKAWYSGSLPTEMMHLTYEQMLEKLVCALVEEKSRLHKKLLEVIMNQRPTYIMDADFPLKEVAPTLDGEPRVDDRQDDE